MTRRISKQTSTRARIAAAAARLMAEDGIDDFALAKRKAAKQLGVEASQALPGNDEIEAELRAYLALYGVMAVSLWTLAWATQRWRRQWKQLRERLASVERASGASASADQ